MDTFTDPPEKWQLYPPGNNIALYGNDGMRLGDAFFLLAGLVVFIGCLIYAFRPKYSEGLRTKSRVGYVFRWLTLDFIVLFMLFFGSFLLGFVIQQMTGAKLSQGMQIDGGLVFAMPVILFGSALFFPKKPMLERAKPFLFIAPFAVMVLKIGCYIEQINFGIPVSWGIQVYRHSPPAYKYGADVRIFPYNICILLLCAVASYLVVRYDKKGKSFLHIPLLLYGSTYFLDFFLGRELGYFGPEYLRLHGISVCHLILIAFGVFLLLCSRHEEKQLKQ